jgi:hypothetical protein
MLFLLRSLLGLRGLSALVATQGQRNWAIRSFGNSRGAVLTFDTRARCRDLFRLRARLRRDR